MSLRCVIVDDNPSFLEDAATMLEREGLSIVGVASNTRDALARVEELQPDVALVDIFLGAESGFDLARRLAESVPVILVSTYAEGDFAELIEEAPVAGFVPKSSLSALAISQLV
jgi:CheY-like chemotaxis protein